MKNRVGSNVNVSEMEIATSEELKIFIAKSTTISSHVSFRPQKFLSAEFHPNFGDPHMTLIPTQSDLFSTGNDLF